MVGIKLFSFFVVFLSCCQLFFYSCHIVVAVSVSLFLLCSLCLKCIEQVQQTVVFFCKTISKARS